MQVERRIEGLETKVRKLEYQLEKSTQRELQLIVMLKMLLERCQQKQKVSTKDIYDTLSEFVSRATPEDQRETSPDLIAELIRKGQV